MNVELLNELADYIEKSDKRRHRLKAFRMNIYFYSCGTPACIAGHLLAMKGVSLSDFLARRSVPTKELGISHEQEQELCYPHYNPYAQTADAGKAARVLRHLAATGIVDWTIP